MTKLKGCGPTFLCSTTCTLPSFDIPTLVSSSARALVFRLSPRAAEVRREGCQAALAKGGWVANNVGTWLGRLLQGPLHCGCIFHFHPRLLHLQSPTIISNDILSPRLSIISLNNAESSDRDLISLQPSILETIQRETRGGCFLYHLLPSFPPRDLLLAVHIGLISPPPPPPSHESARVEAPAGKTGDSSTRQGYMAWQFAGG